MKTSALSAEITVDLDSVKVSELSFDSTSVFVCNSQNWITHSKTIEEILDEYKESIKLQPMVCLNCGGSICRDSMTCEFCGTPYRL